MTKASNIYHSIVNIFCKKLWSFIDPQEQILGMQLDITNACNLQCSHCYRPNSNNADALDFGQWCVVLDQYGSLLRKLHMTPRLTICGGEPLLCDFLFSLIRQIRVQFGACGIYLLSNGTLVTSEIAKQIKKYDVQFQISVDGPDAARNDLFRGKGTFDKIIEGCRYLRKQSVSFYYLAVLSKCTSQWIPEFFSLTARTGSQAMNFTRLIPEGRAKSLCSNKEDAPLRGPELKSAMEQILYHSKKTGVPTATGAPLWHLIEEGLGAPNNVGMSAMVIGYQGDFKVSSRTSTSLGNVLEDSMEKLFLRHPVMRRLRNGDIEGCGECVHFAKCRGDRNISFSEFGHFFGPDTGCWVLPKGSHGLIH